MATNFTDSEIHDIVRNWRLGQVRPESGRFCPAQVRFEQGCNEAIFERGLGDGLWRLVSYGTYGNYSGLGTFPNTERVDASGIRIDDRLADVVSTLEDILEGGE